MKRFVGLWAILAACCLPLQAVASPSARSAVVVVYVTIHGHYNPETPAKITFVPDKVKAGSIVTFKITNSDPVNDHPFEINGRLTKFFIPSGGKAVLSKVVFKKPGQYVGSSPDDYRGVGGIFIVT